MAPSTEHNKTLKPTPVRSPVAAQGPGIPHLCSSQKVNTKLKKTPRCLGIS